MHQLIASNLAKDLKTSKKNYVWKLLLLYFHHWLLSYRHVMLQKTVFWVNWNRRARSPVATALHHFPAYATDLSADLHVWKDETEISRHYAYVRPRAAVFNLWAIGAFCGGLQGYLDNCKFGWKNVLIIGAVGPVGELAQNLRFLRKYPFFFVKII